MSSTPSTSFTSDCDDIQLSGAVKKAALLGSRPDFNALPSPETLPSEADETDPDDEIIEKAYKIIFDVYCGLCPEEEEELEPTFQFTEGQASFERLLIRIEEHPGLQQFFEAEIRFNWSAESGRLTLLLMAFPVHEAVKQDFCEKLRRELDRLADTIPSVREMRDKLRSRGHTYIRRNNSRGRPTFNRSPDGQLRFQGTQVPPYLLEVCWSNGDIAESCDEYFEALRGRVCTFLGIDIDYKPPAVRMQAGYHCAAWISLWTSEWLDDSRKCIEIWPQKEHVQFRDSQGNAVPGRLDMPFKWFIPLKERDGLAEDARDAQVSFDFEDLAKMVAAAEEEQRLFDAETFAAAAVPPNSEEEPTLVFRRGDGSVKRVVTFDAESPEPASKRRRVSVPDTDQDSQGAVSMRTRSRSRSRPAAGLEE